MKTPKEYVDKWESSHNTVVSGWDLRQDSDAGDYGKQGENAIKVLLTLSYLSRLT